jgi:N-acetylmuramoyl-L-alanine amidase
MEFVTPTVGLVTLAGCLTFLITPEEAPRDARIAAALSPSRLPTIVIDPGHGGRDDGGRANGLVEKDLTLDLANRVDQRLQTLGFKTVMTRRSDTYLSLPERAEMANQVEFSLFLSLHFNCSPSPSASGIETYYASEKVLPEPAWSFAGFFSKPEPVEQIDTGENFAGYVQASLLNRTESGNRGIKGKALYVVRHTRAPAILVEGGFLSSLFEARLIATPEYRERLAGAIAEGTAEYARTMPPPPKPPTQLARAAP